MFGIAGATDCVAARTSARVTVLNDSQRDRGPDNDVMVTVGAFTLGNSRLAIQDPSPAGNQPFVSSDGRYHCVFNDETYNYRQLIRRNQLTMHTGWPGEVIPALWAKLAIESLAELRGMYAMALVDSLEERVYLARDPLVIKPLYWQTIPDGSMAFASEVRPLARLAPGPRLDSLAVARYLRLGEMAADQPPFAEMTALPPNSVATFGQSGQLSPRPILANGALEATDTPTDPGSARATSIELHLQADVPTALPLSAGVDSTTIATVDHGLGRRLNYLTIATTGAEDESAEARATALQSGHSFGRVHAELDADGVAGLFRAIQRRTIDGLNTYLGCKAAAICAGLADPYLGKLAARPKRGFGVPMQRWLTESPTPVVDAVSEADVTVWTVADRTVAERAGLPSSSGVRTRWEETWTLAALNAWMETVSPEPECR